MSWLAALPADLHQGALLHKDLLGIRQKALSQATGPARGFPSGRMVERAAEGRGTADGAATANNGVITLVTLPGCSRSCWPRTLYSMLTRRSRFSWDMKKRRRSGEGGGDQLEATRCQLINMNWLALNDKHQETTVTFCLWQLRKSGKSWQFNFASPKTSPLYTRPWTHNVIYDYDVIINNRKLVWII